METTDKPKRAPRRSHYQMAAARKLKYATRISGDGPWVCLRRCEQRWSYFLFDDLWDALSKEGDSCGPNCRKQHNIFRLIG